MPLSLPASRSPAALLAFLTLAVQAAATTPAGCQQDQGLCRAPAADVPADVDIARKQESHDEVEASIRVDLLQRGFGRVQADEAADAGAGAGSPPPAANGTATARADRRAAAHVALATAGSQGNPLGNIVGNIVGAVTHALNSAAVTAFVNAINSTLQALDSKAREGLAAASDYRNELERNVTSAGSQAVNVLVAMVSENLGSLQAKFTEIAGIIQAAVPAITAVIDGLGLGGDLAKGVTDGVKRVQEVTQIVDASLTSVSAVVASLRYAPTDEMESVVAALDAYVQVGFDALNTLESTLMTSLGGVLQRVASELGSSDNSGVTQLDQVLQAIARDWVSGLGDLLRGTAEAAKDAIKAVV